ncbi:hypothetical protein D3C74_486270 [compost metagenome]
MLPAQEQHQGGHIGGIHERAQGRRDRRDARPARINHHRGISGPRRHDIAGDATGRQLHGPAARQPGER